jgi:hypothetical protein
LGLLSAIAVDKIIILNFKVLTFFAAIASMGAWGLFFIRGFGKWLEPESFL